MSTTQVRPSRILQALKRILIRKVMPTTLGDLIEVIEIKWRHGTNIADAQNWLLTLIPKGADRDDLAQRRVLSLHTLHGGDQLLASVTTQQN